MMTDGTMTSHVASGEKLSKVPEEGDWGLFGLYGMDAGFTLSFVFWILLQYCISDCISGIVTGFVRG